MPDALPTTEPEAPDDEEAKAITRSAEIMDAIKAGWPEGEALLRDLYRQGMIDGTRTLLGSYIEIGDQVFGTPTEPGIEPYLPRVCFACGHPIDYCGRRHSCDESRKKAKEQKESERKIRPKSVPRRIRARRKSY